MNFSFITFFSAFFSLNSELCCLNYSPTYQFHSQLSLSLALYYRSCITMLYVSNINLYLCLTHYYIMRLRVYSVSRTAYSFIKDSQVYTSVNATYRVSQNSRYRNNRISISGTHSIEAKFIFDHFSELEVLIIS